MRPLVKIVLLSLLVMGALGYAGYLKTGWQPWDRFWSGLASNESLPELPASLRPDQPLYKWQDRSGRWTYSNQPPPAGVHYETVAVDPDANVVPSVTPPEKNAH